MSDPDDIRNWLRLSDRITTSGRLEEGDPARLRELGVRRVVNLAMADHPEALTDEDRLMAEAGLAYRHIPVPFDAPTEEHYRAFVAALEEDEEPVHVHCIMNMRVSAFFYRWHREAGLDEGDARELLDTIWTPLASEHPTVLPWRRFLEQAETDLSERTS